MSNNTLKNQYKELDRLKSEIQKSYEIFLVESKLLYNKAGQKKGRLALVELGKLGKKYREVTREIQTNKENTQRILIDTYNEYKEN